MCPNTCNFCEVTLPNRASWKTHTERLHPRCFGCRTTFEDFIEFENHFCAHNIRESYRQAKRRMNRNRTTYICGDCWREWPDMKALNTHCCECSGSFSSKASLKNYLVSHSHSHSPHVPKSAHPLRGEPFLQFRCPRCPTAYHKKRELTSHLRRHERMGIRLAMRGRQAKHQTISFDTQSHQSFDEMMGVTPEPSPVTLSRCSSVTLGRGESVELP